LQALPVEQATLIDLVYLREMPTQKAARMIGKSRMFLARKKLAEMLSKAAIETASTERVAW
jgi:DNA-directed RNA polymerase specialized sigma24 family protein